MADAVSMSDTGLTGPAAFRTAAHDWHSWQHCWASQPVPDKYALQVTDQQTDKQKDTAIA